jgi:hypothetical protein
VKAEYLFYLFDKAKALAQVIFNNQFNLLFTDKLGKAFAVVENNYQLDHVRIFHRFYFDVIGSHILLLS